MANFSCSQDVVIIGGGPAGAVTALQLLKAGVKPVIVERERFPRYHIGESLTGEVGARLRELGLEAQLEAANYPIKHGVTVYGPNGKSTFWVPVMRRDENGGLQKATTWQVRRNEFDQMLLDEAVKRGATLWNGRAEVPLMEDGKVVGVRIRHEGGRVDDVATKVVVDASGQSTFLASRGAPTGEKHRGRYDKQVAVFSQVRGTIRDPGDGSGNTMIFYREKGHWAWFIPLDDDLVSVGIVCAGQYFADQQMDKTDFLKQELRTLNPELSRRLPNLDFAEDVRSASNYSYHVTQYTGPGFLCVGDSHRFVDPIFSFGVNFAVNEGRLAGEEISSFLRGEKEGLANPFEDYQRKTERAQDIIQDLVDVFWDHPLPFAMLVHHHRHREGMIDLFAGRIFSEDVHKSEALQAMRKCKTHGKQQSEAMVPVG
ncbi:MAG: NAD(P)/FAD-dependent oxidoreductase [Pirellulaceae bacterium]|jgi:flavin-dependent dehydrogenase